MSNKDERLAISDNLNWAQYHIVLARKCSQEAQSLVDDRGMAGFGNNWELEKAHAKSKEATFHRSCAKGELVEAEKQAGRDFLFPGEVILGARDLNGKNFKHWLAYKKVFAPEKFVDRWSR